MHLEKFLLLSNSKFGHYLFSHGQYLVNRARWLDHYYKKKSEFINKLPKRVRNFQLLKTHSLKKHLFRLYNDNDTDITTELHFMNLTFPQTAKTRRDFAQKQGLYC